MIGILFLTLMYLAGIAAISLGVREARPTGRFSTDLDWIMPILMGSMLHVFVAWALVEVW